VSDPLVVMSQDHTQRLDTLVKSVNTLDLTAGMFLHRRLSVNINLPLHMVQLAGSPYQFALGDSRLMAKWRISADDAAVAFSVMPELYLPTGTQGLFVTDGSAGVGLRAAFEHDFGPVVASANIGYRYSASAQLDDLDYTHRLPLALGVFVPIDRRWGVNAEAAGALLLPLNRYSNPGELYVGGRYQATRDAIFTGGASLGSLPGMGNGSSEFRVVFGLKLSPSPAPIIVAQRRAVFTPKEIQISEEVKFEHASDVLTLSGKGLLDEVAVEIKNNRGNYKLIVIEGHTNELGSFPYNQKLSDHRAQSVKEYLASRGVEDKALLTIGYGKARPKHVAGLSKRAKLDANRRVEFKIVN
jgi:outer membrane protein OmpA-like peptidoglycan-associated protein